MIAEVATIAALSAGTLCFMIGKSFRNADVAFAKERADLAQRHANDWHASYIKIRNEYLAAANELGAIKRKRSETTRRGNLTKSANRRAAIAAKAEELRGVGG